MMEKCKKIMAVLLGIICIFSSCMILNVLAAASAESDGLKAEIITDKNRYSVNENIEIKLNLTNSNSYTISDVGINMTLPDGLSVKKGSLRNTFTTIGGNETKMAAVTAMKEKTVNKPSTNVSNTSAANKATTTKSTSANNKTAATKSTSPKTGDDISLGFWIALMLGSGLLLLLLFCKKKKTGRFFLFLLCIGAVESTVYPKNVQAETIKKSFVIEKEVSIDGNKAVIKAEISYDYEKHFSVTVKDGTTSGLYAEGETVTIKADQAPEGGHFVEWSVEKGSVTLKDMKAEETTFVMPGEDVELQALYNVDDYILSVRKLAGGEIHFEGEKLLRETAELRTLKVPMNGNEIQGTLTIENDVEIESIRFNGQSFNHDDIYGVNYMAPSNNLKVKPASTVPPVLSAKLRLFGITGFEKQELSIQVSLTNGTVQMIKTDLTEHLKNFGSGELEPLVLDAMLTLPSEAGITGGVSDWNTVDNGEVSAEIMQQPDTYAVNVQGTNENVQMQTADHAWNVNDKIGVYMLKAESTDIVVGAENRLYQTEDGGSAFTATGDQIIYFPVDGSKVDFTAYYPYIQTLTDGKFGLDVSSQSDLSKLDLMTAKQTSTQEAPLDKNHSAVELKFSHRLTKIKLNVQAGNGITAEELKDLKVEMTNQRTNVTYDPLHETLGVDGEAVKSVLLNTNSDGTVAEAILLPNTTVDEMNPIVAGRELIFTLKETGETFCYSIPDDKLYQSGDQNVYTVTLNRKTYPVTVTDGTASGLYAEGRTVTIKADQAPEGAHFAEWSVKKGSVTLKDANAAETTFVMPGEEVELQALYNVDFYVLSVSKFTGGEIYFDEEELLRETEELWILKVPMNGTKIQGTLTLGEDVEVESIRFNGISFDHDDIYGISDDPKVTPSGTQSSVLSAALRLLDVISPEEQELKMAITIKNDSLQMVQTDIEDYLKKYESGELEPPVLEAALTQMDTAEITGIISDWNTVTNEEISAEIMRQPDTYEVTMQEMDENLQMQAAGSVWTANDEIGVYMLEANSMNISEGAENRLYQTEDGGDTFTAAPGQKIYFPVDGSKVDFTAYYPYIQTLIDGKFSLDVSNQSDLSKLDLMTAQLSSNEEAPLHKNHSDVALKFGHRLTKIRINIQAGEGIIAEELKDLTVEITNQRTNITYDPLHENLGIESEPVQGVLLNMNSDGTVAEAVLAPNTTADEMNPVVADRKLIFTMKETGESFCYSIPDDKVYHSGDQNIYTVTLKRERYIVNIIGGDGSGSYAPGETVNISAPDVAGKSFIGWEVESGMEVQDQDSFISTDAQTSFIMPACTVVIGAIYGASKEAANAEAEKIKGIIEVSEDVYDVIFGLIGYEDLAADVNVDVVCLKNGSSSETAVPTELEGIITEGQLLLNKSKAVAASDLTYVGLVYTVTLDGTASDEREIDVSSLFTENSIIGRLRLETLQ